MLLFCIPHAGGSSLAYIKWKKYLLPSITFIPLDLPGHITRQSEPLCENFLQALNDLYQKIMTVISDSSEDFSIYGHSLGAVFAYELYQLLEDKNQRLPKSLFLSGRWPPYLKKKEDRIYRNYEDFKSYFSMEGNQNNLLELEEDTGEYFYKVIYSDLKLLDSYPYNKAAYSIYSDIYVLWGDNDKSMSYKDVSEWKKAAKSMIYFKQLSGAHLFPTDNAEETVEYMNRTLQKYVLNELHLSI